MFKNHITSPSFKFLNYKKKVVFAVKTNDSNIFFYLNNNLNQFYNNFVRVSFGVCKSYSFF